MKPVKWKPTPPPKLPKVKGGTAAPKLRFRRMKPALAKKVK